MTLTLDGFAVLRRIGDNRAAFPELEAKVAALAERLLKTELASHALDTRAFAAIVDAVGADAVSLVVESLKPSELRRLRASLARRGGKTSREAAAIIKRIAGDAHPKRAAAKAASHQPASPLGTAAMRASRGR